MRRCIVCGKYKPFTDFWNCRSCRGGKDYICADDRRKRKLERAATPFGLYSSRCRILTDQVRRLYIEPRPGDDFSLDHRYSISAAFEKQTAIEIVCCPFNLEWIPRRHNLGKGVECSITFDELIAGANPDDRIKRYASELNRITDPDFLMRFAVALRTKDKNEE